MSRRLKAAILCSVIGVIGMVASVTPPGGRLEENIGLETLFHARGTRQPPPEVVIVAIDKDSAETLNLNTAIEKWPRSLHARLVRNLIGAGAAVIAFDIFFHEEQSAEYDRELAEAIRDACSVILCISLEKDTVPLAEPAGGHEPHLIAEKKLTPAPVLSRSALALAPFPLPKVPVRVSRYWTFKGVEGSPTLPVAAFQVFTLDLYNDFLHLIERASPSRAGELPQSRGAIVEAKGVENLIAHLREIFLEEPVIAERILQEIDHPGAAHSQPDRDQTRKLKSLIRMYQGDNSRYLNFYGPPGTIPIIPYHKALQLDNNTSGESAGIDFKGKAVFIGVSGYTHTQHRDGFYTVFSQPNGVDISGVEIAATAFANILEDMHLKPLHGPWLFLFIFLWGLALGALCYLFPPAVSALSIIGLGMIYFIVAQHQFESAGRWHLLVVPLLIQAPAAFFGALLWKYFHTNRERRNIRKAFGYYIPEKIIDQAANNIISLKAGGEVIFGTCLCTDGGKYTTLSENAHPREIADFLNRYYTTIFQPVRDRGGMVSDIVGDSMMALWQGGHDDTTSKESACMAALEIDEAVKRFNAAQSTLKLETRIGLDSGRISLGNIGGLDHYEYRPVGDAVNTASRIEQANKHFGTRVLASGNVLSGLNRFLTREVGCFVLAGKSKPVILHELIGRIDDSDAKSKALCDAFAEGLSAYRKQQWEKAIRWFCQSIAIRNEDGPAKYYLVLCERYKQSPPTQGEWDGLICLGK